jgi:hypothetical protein
MPQRKLYSARRNSQRLRQTFRASQRAVIVLPGQESNGLRTPEGFPLSLPLLVSCPLGPWAKRNYSIPTFGASLEIGKRWDFGHFYLEPQGQIEGRLGRRNRLHSLKRSQG